MEAIGTEEPKPLRGAEELGEWVSGSLRLADVGEHRCHIHSDSIPSNHPVCERFMGLRDFSLTKKNVIDSTQRTKTEYE